MLYKVFRQLIYGHPVDARSSLVGLDLFQCRLAVFTLDDFFHQLFGNGRAFGPTVLPGHFGPFSDILQSFTPIPCHESQLQLVILPLGAHAFRCLLATSFTSTSPVETVRAFVPCGTNTPSADFCRPVRMDRSTLSHDIVTDDRSPEVSSTVFDAQPPDLRFALLMDVDFAIRRSLVLRSRLRSSSCKSARAFAPRFFQTPPRDDALALH